MRLGRVIAGVVILLAALPVLGIATLTVVPDAWLARLDYEPAGERLVTGLFVSGTAARPVLYVSSSDPRIGAGESGEDLNLDTNSGVISRLTRTASGWKRLDLVRGLPRSEENHATNGLALDSSTKTLYVAQGANTNEGAPSHHFAYLPEYALSGSVLVVDLARIGDSTYDLPTLDDERRDGNPDDHDPFGGGDGRNQAVVDAGGPVQLYATGLRNPYDIIRTASGRLYTIQNGGATEWGDVPANEGPDGRCTNEPREPGHYDRDTLHLVQRGGFYGHPNPTRGNRANTFNDDRQSPVQRADPVNCDYRRPAERRPITSFRTSTNGLEEYTASNLGGSLRGDLLAVSLDGRTYDVKLDESGSRAMRTGILFTLVAPLDVTSQGDDDPFPGTVWIAQHDETALQTGEEPDLHVYEPVDFMNGSHWKGLAASGEKRQEVSYVRVGRRFYLAGGGTTQEVYNPETDEWHRVAPLPRSLDHIQGVAVGGRIYYIGGLEAWPRPDADSVYIYDPASDRFTTGARMLLGRGAGGVAVHDGKIYYAGGLHDGRAVAWFDVYDPETDSWTRLPDMPRARDHFHAVAVDGRLYAIGGRDSELGAEISETDVFDFASGTWSSGLEPIPTRRGGFAAAVLDHEIFVMGGETADGAKATVEAYDVRRDSWRPADPLPAGRHGFQAVTCGGAIYVAAGGLTEGGENPSALQEVYLPRGARGCGRPRPSPARVVEPRFRHHAVEGTSSFNPTVLQFGPDGRLYVAQQNGMIKVYDVVRRTDGGYEATATEEITAIQRISNHDDDGSSVSDLPSILGVVREHLGF